MIVAVLLSVISIFGPMMVYFSVNLVGDIEFIIYALTWHLRLSNVWIPTIGAFTIFAGLPFSVLRFGFIWRLYHFYQTGDGKRGAILLGLLAELQSVIVVVFAAIIGPLIDSTPYTPSYVFFLFPIPILFLTGVVFVIATPPKSQPSLFENRAV